MLIDNNIYLFWTLMAWIRKKFIIINFIRFVISIRNSFFILILIKTLLTKKRSWEFRTIGRFILA